jgi:hypothetical protein
MNTMQEEFDIVVKHLYKQGRPSKNTKNPAQCAYRGVNNLTCAVGCRIPDSRYSKLMDSNVLVMNELVETYGHRLRQELTAYKDMFASLQNAHDQCITTERGTFNVKNLAHRLTLVARQYGVKFTKPKKEKACN